MPTGMNTTYDLTVGVPVNMDQAIYMYSPDDSPFITGRSADGRLILPTLPTDEKRFDWLDENRLTPESRLSAAATTGDAFLTVQSGERERFSTGDIVIVAGGSELIRISGYSVTTATILLTASGRAFAGSTATNYASGDLVMGLGTLLAEGSDPEDARSIDRVNQYNLTQIFGPTKVEMSRTEQGRTKYGVANEFTHQLDQRTIENVIARERNHIYSARYESSTTKHRLSGGLNYWITTNEDSTVTQLTVAHIETNLQTCYNNGGVPDVLMANPASLGDLNDIADNDRVRVTIEDPIRGRMPVMTVWTEFGVMTVLRNRWLHPTQAFGFRTGQAIRRVFDPLVFERLAKTGDSDKGQIVCEEGLEVKGESHAFKMTNLTYSYNF